MVSMKQRHASGTTDFILDDNIIYVFAGDSKPIKRVTEGETIMKYTDSWDNADLSQEFLMMKRTGIAVILNKEFGAYRFS